MTAAPDDPWSGLTPDDLAALLAEVRVDWWVCGGWALDLWLGEQTRSHGDMDVGCRTHDVVAFVDALDSWEAYRAEDGAISALPRPLTTPPRGMWLRRSGTRAWDIQLMPEEEASGRWRYRRDPTVERPFHEVVWRADAGLLVLRPEVQLLYKAKDVRPQDQADFDRVLPTLGPHAREWLAGALRATAPASPWLGRLEP